MIYFHDKIWNHWVIYSYLGYISRYTLVAVVLCRDNINDWSILYWAITVSYTNLLYPVHSPFFQSFSLQEQNIQSGLPWANNKDLVQDQDQKRGLFYELV